MSEEPEYFSDRECGAIPPTREVIQNAAWNGIATAIRMRIADGSLGMGFPETCPDKERSGVIGANAEAVFLALTAEIPAIPLPFDPAIAPPTMAILDLVEFTWRHVGKPIPRGHHHHFGHDHLTFDCIQGRAEFRQDINRILSRNGLAFELGDDGKIVRLASSVLQESLLSSAFRTGDEALDLLLETARIKFFNPDPAVRREALEKLWDAWERLKTIQPGADKKASVTALLDRACTEPNFRAEIDDEARVLTKIGNAFQIRHSETSQVPLSEGSHVDYLFHRLFALIWMLSK